MFKPLNERVLILPEEEKPIGGIILPDSAKEKKLRGTIVVGGKSTKEGDMVLFPEFGFDKVKVEQVEYYIVAENALLGIFDSK